MAPDSTTEAAAAIYGVPYSSVTPEMRKATKEMLYASHYNNPRALQQLMQETMTRYKARQRRRRFQQRLAITLLILAACGLLGYYLWRLG